MSDGDLVTFDETPVKPIVGGAYSPFICDNVAVV